MSARRYATVEDVNNDTSIQTGKECFDACLAEGAARERERLLKEHGAVLRDAANVLILASDMGSDLRALIEALGGEV